MRKAPLSASQTDAESELAGYRLPYKFQHQVHQRNPKRNMQRIADQLQIFNVNPLLSEFDRPDKALGQATPVCQFVGRDSDLLTQFGNVLSYLLHQNDCIHTEEYVDHFVSHIGILVKNAHHIHRQMQYQNRHFEIQGRGIQRPKKEYICIGIVFLPYITSQSSIGADSNLTGSFFQFVYFG